MFKRLTASERGRFAALMVVALLVVGTHHPVSAVPAAPAWQPPKDELLTDKQVASYLDVTRDYLASLKAAGKALQGGQSSPLLAGQVLAATDERFKASLARHGMTQEEYQWVGGKVWEAKGFLLFDATLGKAVGDADEKLKMNAEDQSALKQKIATYEKALKDGRRVMAADERAEAVKAAEADRQSAEEEAKGHADTAKEAAAAAAKAEAEAKSALALAAKPPADVSADDRENYAVGKKKDAEDSAAEAKEQREKEAEEKKSLAECKAKAAAAVARAKDPEVPLTDEEKAQAKQEAQDALERAKSDLQSDTDAQKVLSGAAEKLRKDLTDRRAAPAAKNAAVFKPHAKEFDDVMSAAK